MFLSWHRGHPLSLRILRQPKLPPGLNLPLQLHLCLRFPPLHPKHLFLHPQRQSLRPVVLLHRLLKEDVRLLCLNGPLRPHHHPQRYPRNPLPPLLRLSPPYPLRAQNQPRSYPFLPPRRLGLLRRQVRLHLVRAQASSSISIMRISMK
jgi:hypothetical protein